MTAFPEVDSAPGVEVWKEDNEWKKDGVEKGVFKTAKTMEFTEEQFSHWRAIFNFHKTFKASDTCPPMPISLVQGHAMQGTPGWHELWSTLRRFPRPHLQQEQASSDAGANDGNDSDDSAPSDAEEQQETPLAVSNGVTGGMTHTHAHVQWCASVQACVLHASERASVRACERASVHACV